MPSSAVLTTFPTPGALVALESLLALGALAQGSLLALGIGLVLFSAGPSRTSISQY